jgi:putative lipoic acid-binding regulatory protein
MNGHHPHKHIVLKCFDVGLLDICRIEKELLNVWVSCCKKAGFKYKIIKDVEQCSNALHIGKTGKRHPLQVAEYLNKLSMELTLHSKKFSKKGNYNAFGLLKECRDIDEYIKEHKNLTQHTIVELCKIKKFLLARFSEYAQGMKRKPTVLYKHNKNHDFKIKTDSDIEKDMQEEDEVNGEWVIQFQHYEFKKVYYKNIMGLLLDLLQAENYLLFFQTLKAHKIKFTLNEEFEPIKDFVLSVSWKGFL